MNYNPHAAMWSFASPELGENTGLHIADLLYLDEVLLDGNGRLKLHPAAFYSGIPILHLRGWANLRGRYVLPTRELVDWLKETIAGRKTIEIGAGNGDLGFHLGIHMTDSYQQVTDRGTRQYFELYGIAPTNPPKDVERIDGESAMRRHKPKVVVAGFVTQKWIARHLDSRGNYLGVRHEYIIERCETFVFIGNEVVHGTSRALSLPHETLKFPWLISRAQRPDANCVYLWRNSTRLHI